MPVTAEKGAEKWEPIFGRMQVVRLRWPLLLLVPAMIVPSFSKSTRGLTLYPGRGGLAIGATMVGVSLVLGALTFRATGVIGPVASFWVIGSAGLATFASAIRPTAFVKPICTECRLLPVIKEHEAIHLSGVASEKAVWSMMKTRHTHESLALKGDPAICSFCPIPKRLSEH